MKHIRYIALFSLLIFPFVKTTTAENVQPKDANIHYEGIKFISTEADGSLSYQRFTDAIYQLNPPRAKKG